MFSKKMSKKMIDRFILYLRLKRLNLDFYNIKKHEKSKNS